MELKSHACFVILRPDTQVVQVGLRIDRIGHLRQRPSLRQIYRHRGIPVRQRERGIGRHRCRCGNVFIGYQLQRSTDSRAAGAKNTVAKKIHVGVVVQSVAAAMHGVEIGQQELAHRAQHIQIGRGAPDEGIARIQQPLQFAALVAQVQLHAGSGHPQPTGLIDIRIQQVGPVLIDDGNAADTDGHAAAGLFGHLKRHQPRNLLQQQVLSVFQCIDLIGRTGNDLLVD